MKERVVVDSACLIALDRIDRLDILQALYDPILVPPAVGREIGMAIEWMNTESPADRSQVEALKIRVDDGEAEAIALASERKCQIVLDDLQARAVGKEMGLKVVGTVGSLVLAKRAGIISAILPLLDDLATNGFYLSEALRKEALKLAGE